MEPVLKVQIWSDLICPWCWIAEQRFERALSRFPHIDKVDFGSCQEQRPAQ